LAQRADQAVVPAADDQGPAGGRLVLTQDDPHGGGLAGPVRPEEAGHPAGADGEAQVIDRGHRAEPLAEPVDLDHAGPGRKYALELRRHRNTTAARPASQTTSAQSRLARATGVASPARVSTVARPNSTVPVIRAQPRPSWQERARTSQTTAAITPP